MDNNHFLTLDDGTALAYRVDGNPRGPALAFSNSLGTDLTMWDAQAAALADRFLVVRYDTRGHGRSGLPEGPLSLGRLGADLLALLDQLQIERAHLCGLSLGGMTAQWLAIHHPARVARLVIANSAARIGSYESWAARIAAVTAGGMDAVAGTVLQRFFSPAFRSAQPQVVARFGQILGAIPPAAYAACCAALRDADLRALIADGVRAPTLVIGGAIDEATPPELSAQLHASIAGSQLQIFAEVAHLSNIERPAEFSALLERFLTGA